MGEYIRGLAARLGLPVPVAPAAPVPQVTSPPPEALTDQDAYTAWFRSTHQNEPEPQSFQPNLSPEEIDQRLHPQSIQDYTEESVARRDLRKTMEGSPFAAARTLGATAGQAIGDTAAGMWHLVTGLFAGHTGEVLPITQQAFHRESPILESLSKVPEQLLTRAMTVGTAPFQLVGSLGSGIAKAIRGDYTAPFTDVAQTGMEMARRAITGEASAPTAAEEAGKSVVKELGFGDIIGAGPSAGGESFVDTVRHFIGQVYPDFQNLTPEARQEAAQTVAELGYMVATDPLAAVGAAEGAAARAGAGSARAAAVAKIRTLIGEDAAKGAVYRVAAALKEAHAKMMANPESGSVELPFGGGVPMRKRRTLVDLPAQPGDLFHKPGEAAEPIQSLTGKAQELPGQAPVQAEDFARQARFAEYLDSSWHMTPEQYAETNPAQRRAIMAQFTQVEPLPLVPGEIVKPPEQHAVEAIAPKKVTEAERTKRFLDLATSRDDRIREASRTIKDDNAFETARKRIVEDYERDRTKMAGEIGYSESVGESPAPERAPKAAAQAGVTPPPPGDAAGAEIGREGGVPAITTRDFRQQLLDLGWSRADFDTLTPEQAYDLVKAGKMKVKAPAPAQAGNIPPPSAEAAGAGAGGESPPKNLAEKAIAGESPERVHDTPTAAGTYEGPERRVGDVPVANDRRARASGIRDFIINASEKDAEGRVVNPGAVPSLEDVEEHLAESEAAHGPTSPDPQMIRPGELAPGDSVTIDGEKYSVEPGSEPGTIKLRDGREFDGMHPDAAIPIDAGSHVTSAAAKTFDDAAMEEMMKAAHIPDPARQALDEAATEEERAHNERVFQVVGGVSPDGLKPGMSKGEYKKYISFIRGGGDLSKELVRSLARFFRDDYIRYDKKGRIKSIVNLDEFWNRVPPWMRGREGGIGNMDQAAQALFDYGLLADAKNMDGMGEMLKKIPNPYVRTPKSEVLKAIGVEEAPAEPDAAKIIAEAGKSEAPPSPPPQTAENDAKLIKTIEEQNPPPSEPPAGPPPPSGSEPPQKPPSGPPPSEGEPPSGEPPKEPDAHDLIWEDAEPPSGEPPRPPPEPPSRPPRPPYPTGPWRQELTSRTFEALGADVAADPETVALLRDTESGRRGVAGGDDWTADAIYEAYQKAPHKFPSIDAIRQESGMTVKDFADEVLMSSSESGRRLNYLSVARGQIVGSIDRHIERLVSEPEAKRVIVTDGKTGQTIIRGTAESAEEARRMASRAKPGDRVQIAAPITPTGGEGPKPPPGGVTDPTIKGIQNTAPGVLETRTGPVPPGGVTDPTIKGIQNTAPGVLETRTGPVPPGGVGETIRPVPEGMQPHLPGTEGPAVHFDGTVEEFLGKTPAEQSDIFVKNPKALKALREMQAMGDPPLTNRQKWLNGGAMTRGLGWWPGYRKISNAVRTAMTLTLSNLSRNFLTQGVRIGLFNSIEAATETVFARLFGGDATAWQRQARILEKLPEMFTSKGRNTIDSMMAVVPRLEERLGNTMLEVEGGKTGIFSKLYHYTVGIQERFYRRAVVAGTLEHMAFTEGFEPMALGRKIVGQEAVDYMRAHPLEALNKFGDQAVDAALEATWAEQPRPNTFAAGLMKVFEKIPEAHTVIPYPRFYMNATRYLWDRNPLQTARLLLDLDPMNRGASVGLFAKGGNAATQAARAKMMGKVVSGSVALGAGLYLVSNYAGSNWHSLNIGGKDRDFMGFAPLVQPLFYATLIKKGLEAREDVRKAAAQGQQLDGFTAFHDRMSDMTRTDMLQGFAPINRVSSTPLVLTQQPPAKNEPEWYLRALFSVIGNFLGGFSTPVRNVRDLLSGVSEDQAEREKRASFAGPEPLGPFGPLFGPTLGNLPYAQRANEPMPSPFQADVPASDYPLTKMVTGVAVSDIDPHPVAYWARKLGFSPGEYSVHTGIPQADREANAMIGKVAERAMHEVIDMPGFDKMTPALQRKLFDAKMSKIAIAGRKFYVAQHPEYQADIAKERIPDNLRAALQGMAIERQRRIEEQAGKK